MADTMKKIQLPSGDTVPLLGQGTWKMGEDKRLRKDEVAALRVGLDLGMTLIDTAEMYADGGAEEVVGEAISGRRDEVFIVTKFLPQHAGRRLVASACERSLERLGVDCVDLYLYHWRGDTPLVETLKGLYDLLGDGKIRRWGVSNFDTNDMQELVSLPGGEAVATNQVLYNLKYRGLEWDLLPWCRGRRIPLMAYSPVDEGRLRSHPALKIIGARRGVTQAQVALAWLARQDVMVIPKASHPEHVRENRRAVDIELDAQDLKEIDDAFPGPSGPTPLETV